jgi:predicted ABC-type transport system involved in lysophospholipase L1 biosynthesis ATPase subunit
MSSIVIVEHISKTLGDIRVIDDVSLDVKKGEFLAIQGPSGSGKTTLLALLAGLEKVDTGSISVGEHNLTSMSEDQLALFRRSNVGFVFQSFNLIPTLNVVENVALPLFPTSVPAREIFDRATKAAIAVGLGDRLKHYPNQLSGGEQQRVAVARSLINNPQVIFADEPTGNLDTKTGEKIIELLRQLNREKNQTFVLVTHDDRIAGESDRIVKIIDGSIGE